VEQSAVWVGARLAVPVAAGREVFVGLGVGFRVGLDAGLAVGLGLSVPEVKLQAAVILRIITRLIHDLNFFFIANLLTIFCKLIYQLSAPIII
jgi:hypothetical protein